MMAGNSAIEWTEATWNPVVGCSIVSPGCTNCYAMKMAARIEAMNAAVIDYSRIAKQYDGTTRRVNGNAIWTGKLALAPENVLLAPLKRKKPTIYFVNSMGDLFHEDCPDEWIDKVFAVMALCPQHTFQVLTKRAKRMRDYLTKPYSPGKFITIADDGARTDTPSAQIRAHSAMCDIMPRAPARALNEACAWQDKRYPGGDGLMREWPLPNVWLGVSTERQQEADERIPELLKTPAAVRFISAEPLLGPIDLTNLGGAGSGKSFGAHGFSAVWTDNAIGRPCLDWTIVGGESGPGSRPMHPDWARSLRNQCSAAGVRFFFKQWGEYKPKYSFGDDGAGDSGFGDVPEFDGFERVGKKAAGRLLDGVLHNAMPEIAQ